MDLSAYRQAASRPNRDRPKGENKPDSGLLNKSVLNPSQQGMRVPQKQPKQHQGHTSKPAQPQQKRDWSHAILERVTMRRKQAADLMEGVLEERFKPVFALTRWPENQDNDLSLDVAYHILWHHESDEDNQQQEVFYMDAQLELMTQVIRYMSQGKPLPPYFVSAYSPDMTTSLFKERTFFQEIVMMIHSGIRFFSEALKQF